MGPRKRTLLEEKPPPGQTKKPRSQNVSTSPPLSNPLEPVRKRPDVARIKAHNKDIDVFTVKQTLRAFTRPEGEQLAWDECIREMNRAIAEAYLVANYYVLRQLEAQQPLPTIDQAFYQKCLSIVTNTRYKLKGAENDDWRFTRDSFNEMRGGTEWAETRHLPQGWFQNAAREMATNAKNTVRSSFGKRLRTYVIDKYELVPKDARDVVGKVFDPEPFLPRPRERKDQVVVELRRMLTRIEDKQISTTDSGKISWAPEHLLPVLFEFLEYVEQWNRDHEKSPKFKARRRFNLLPTKQGYVCTYCKVDSTALRSLILRSPGVQRDLVVVDDDEKVWTLAESLDNKERIRWTQLAGLWWRKLFRVDQLEKKAKGTFHREISTDGYGVAVLFDRLTRGVKKKDYDDDDDEPHGSDVSNVYGISLAKRPKTNLNEYDVVWGVDPGRTDFITAAGFDVNTMETKRIRYRTSDFRRASGYNRSNRISRHRIDKVPGLRQLLRDSPTKKTASAEILSEAIRYWFAHGPGLLATFMDPVYRKLKFRRYAVSNAKLDRACFELAGPRGTRTVVGFGDSGLAGAGFIKGSVAGPVKRFVQKLSRYCEVVVVDEYLTSQIHSACRSPERLEHPRVMRQCRDGKTRNVPVYKVLHCLTKNDGCGKTVDRDVNAAENMLGILTNQLLGVPRDWRLQRDRN